ncbi:MAG TPA: DUF2971 domain-containing protein [Paludibacter sp.]
MESLTKADLDKITTEDLSKLLSIDRVFKYTSLSSGINDILLKSTLKFSDPTEYNDPFDCHAYLLKVDMSNANIEAFVDLQYPNLSRNLKRELIRRFNTDEIYKGIESERKRFKITCFSLDKKNTLMWSHYADKHKGICIGFQFPLIYEDKFILSPVSYFDKTPLIEGLADAMKLIRYWLSMKSDCWEYEQEIRAIRKSKSISSFEYIQFERSCVKEIIFGCKVTQNEIDNSKKLLKLNGFDLKNIFLKKMVIDKDTFKLKEVLL